MSKILVAVLILFAAQVLCETNTDVMISFNKIYEKLHAKINIIETNTHSLANYVTRQYFSDKFTVERKIQLVQKQAKTLNSLNVNTTLKELNISAEQARDCIVKNNEHIQHLVLHSDGGFSVCNISDWDVTTSATNQLADLYHNQTKEHQLLEATRLDCNVTSHTVEELRNCLSYELFVERVNSIKQLEKNSELEIENYVEKLQASGNNLKICTNGVLKVLEYELNDVENKFTTCCRHIK